MKMYKLIMGLLVVIAVVSCKDKPVEPTPEPTEPTVPTEPTPVEITPVDINTEGLGFMESIQGHWTGQFELLGTPSPWFAWDFRAISPSHVHGIFEGGSQGNLLTSFFVTDFKGKRTIMARNGGLLNGIYRASYFVLDSVKHDANGDWYRFVDAFGGVGIMSMELRFNQGELFFNAYTSRFGLILPPSLHQSFQGTIANSDLAATAAAVHNFPQNVVEHDFSGGFNESDFWINTGDTEPHSATFLEYDKDPYKIVDHSYIAYLDVTCVRDAAIQNSELLVYLTKSPVVDAAGNLDYQTLYSTLLKFPTLISTDNVMSFTYLHPGDYYITVIADDNMNQGPDQGEITSVSMPFTVNPNGIQSVTISDIDVTIQN